MKKIAILSLLSTIAISCANSVATAPPKVGEFTLEQIDGRGCGMTLWKPGRANQNQFVLFNGLNDNSMEMMINGRITKFHRIKASGQKFYGQQTSQSFRNSDGEIQVDVVVKLGTPGEIESVNLKEGTIRVKQNSQEVRIPVVGDAGC